MGQWLRRIRTDAAGAVAWLCAALMLCVLPLLFRNGFFDINRVKVSAVCHGVPLLLTAFAGALVPVSYTHLTLPTTSRV